MPSTLRLLLVLSALAGAGEAWAGTLYKCVDKHGVTAFTSSRAGYSQCKLLGNFANPPPAATPAPATSSAPAPAARVDFRTATGGAQPAPAPSSEGARVTRGAVYKYVKNGVSHYTNRRPAGQHVQVLFTYMESCFACSVSSSLDFHNVALNITDYAAEIATAVSLHGVDPALVRAIVHAESAFKPNAVSRVGAQGLMQLMPATATRFGVSSAFDPGENIKGGTNYLAWLGKRYNNDVRRIAAAYNAGEGAVDKYGGVPPYQETLVFVERVGILHDRYKTALAAQTTPAATPIAAGSPSSAGGAN